MPEPSAPAVSPPAAGQPASVPVTRGAAAPPLVPAYDDLPDGSDLRREYSASGLSISAPAGEVPESARRAAAVAAMLSSPIVPAVLLGVVAAAGMLIFRDNLARHSPGMRLVAEASFAAFVLGVFLLAWHVDRTARLDALARGRRQTTVIYATRERLLIETGGPFGAASHDVEAGRIRALEVQSIRFTDPGGGKRIALLWLVITLTDGSAIRILPGREDVELRWAAGAVGNVIGVTG